MTVCAATKWISNADMIVDVVELGYIKPTDFVVDLTYGRGKWWTLYDHPGRFLANVDSIADAPERVSVICEDFRDLGQGHDDMVDVVVFDPPYISMGGRATSTLPDFMDRYGLENAATTPSSLQADNERGLREAMRITRPGGLILAKCAPYISSGVRQDGDWWARDAALAMGLAVHDMLLHIGDVRAQPKSQPCKFCAGASTDDQVYSQCPKCGGTGRIERKVKHARNNYSVLFVFKKPKPRARKKAT